jgi:hypothetical protein
MLLRGWLLRVLAGVALVFLGCVLALIAAERVYRRSGPPQSITVDEAEDYHITFLDHVRLTDAGRSARAAAGRSTTSRPTAG